MAVVIVFAPSQQWHIQHSHLLCSMRCVGRCFDDVNIVALLLLVGVVVVVLLDDVLFLNKLVLTQSHSLAATATTLLFFIHLYFPLLFFDELKCENFLNQVFFRSFRRIYISHEQKKCFFVGVVVLLCNWSVIASFF